MDRIVVGPTRDAGVEYARYRALGLIISSGPVEAAAKTIIGHPLTALQRQRKTQLTSLAIRRILLIHQPHQSGKL